MGDGSWSGYGLRLHTNNFTKDEVILLKNSINNKFNFNSSINVVNLEKGQYIIYIHNSSAFDMIFLLNKITSYKLVSKIKPIINDNKFINLEVFYEIGDKTYKLTFAPKGEILIYYYQTL